MGSKNQDGVASDAKAKRKRSKADLIQRAKKRKLDKKQKKQQELEEVKEKANDANGANDAEEVQESATEEKAIAQTSTLSTWKISKPMGGFMADIDPVFTLDEEHLIIAYSSWIQVYSTSDSLVERRIDLPSTEDSANASQRRRITATFLSPLNSQLVWISCSDGAIFRADWETGALEEMKRKEGCPQHLISLVAAVVYFGVDAKELLYLSEGEPDAWGVTVYDATTLSTSDGHVLFSAPPPDPQKKSRAIESLLVAENGQFIIGSSGPTAFVGERRKTQNKGLEGLAYELYSVDTVDEIASMDLRVNRSNLKRAVLDLVVGGARGAIFVYADVLNRLRPGAASAASGKRARKVPLQPRQYKWHRGVVNSVKWSLDGNYFLSGGTEQGVAFWQEDTSRRDYLPHLGATIENIVISPSGTSFALHLDDNSTMIIPTAEWHPSFYVSGLQSLAFIQTPYKDANVRRAWRPVDNITQPIPATLSPLDASRICLRVGNGNKVSMTGDMPSASMLQTFDVTSFHSLAKQPLSRTNLTSKVLAPSGFPIIDPTITQLCVSNDGRWLASVDDWQPPQRDISDVSKDVETQDNWSHQRREVNLKFWSVPGNKDRKKDAVAPTYELITNIEEPHATAQAETVFGIAADRQHSNRFATVGDDAVVRFWAPKTRVSDGIVIKDKRGQPLSTFHCTRAVPLLLNNTDHRVRTDDLAVYDKTPRYGALAFSDDGSTLFVGFGARDEGVLYAIDTDTGVVRKRIDGLFRGDVRGVEVLDGSLVLLSWDLVVYDIVADAQRYRTPLLGDDVHPDVSAMIQLAAGRLSQTFLVSVPFVPATEISVAEIKAEAKLIKADNLQDAARRAAEAVMVVAGQLRTAELLATKNNDPSIIEEAEKAHARAVHKAQLLERDAERATRRAQKKFNKVRPSWRPASKLLVFSPESEQPLLDTLLPNMAVSLLPEVGPSGYLVIDATAQVWSVLDGVGTTALALPLSEMHLEDDANDKQKLLENGNKDEDDEEDEEDGVLVRLNGNNDDDDDDMDVNMDGDSGLQLKMADASDDEDDNEDEDAVHAVFAPQKLRDIFETTSTATTASVEDLFWQVSRLLIDKDGGQ